VFVLIYLYMDRLSSLQTLDSITIICSEQTRWRNDTHHNGTQHSNKKTTFSTTNVDSLCWALCYIDCHFTEYLGANTLAYFAGASMTNKKVWKLCRQNSALLDDCFDGGGFHHPILTGHRPLLQVRIGIFKTLYSPNPPGALVNPFFQLALWKNRGA